ncbi:CsbD family protein [Roseinatronobacter monicus]|uniref:CsbD family protein n=1 Tax=Roseinatronobacter monicus TaxID=393481 RepID=UPI003F3905FA
MDKDRIKGSVKQAKGAAKETLGKLSNDPVLQARGKLSKLAGSIQKAFGKAKDRFRKG